MTQYRDDPDRISNYFDKLLSGLGKRGSSFTDVDALTHDMDTDRFLFQEFKGPDGVIPKGQNIVLRALARKDYVTVWAVRLRADGLLDWRDIGSQETRRGIDSSEYQARFRAWWANTPYVAPEELRPTGIDDGVTAADIRW